MEQEANKWASGAQPHAVVMRDTRDHRALTAAGWIETAADGERLRMAPGPPLAIEDMTPASRPEYDATGERRAKLEWILSELHDLAPRWRAAPEQVQVDGSWVQETHDALAAALMLLTTNLRTLDPPDGGLVIVRVNDPGSVPQGAVKFLEEAVDASVERFNELHERREVRMMICGPDLQVSQLTDAQLAQLGLMVVPKAAT